MYTIKDIADKFNTTKPTVRKYYNLIPEAIRSEESKTELGTLLVSEKILLLIAEKMGKKVDLSENPVENTSEKPETPDKTENHFPQTSEIYLEKIESLVEKVNFLEKHMEKSDNQISILNNQLAEKDKQLSEKDKQIEDLHKLLDQQQQLNKQIQDNQQLMLPERKEHRLLWWKWYT